MLLISIDSKRGVNEAMINRAREKKFYQARLWSRREMTRCNIAVDENRYAVQRIDAAYASGKLKLKSCHNIGMLQDER